MRQLFDNLPFSCWRDNTRSPVTEHWPIKLPVIVTTPDVVQPPSSRPIQLWKLDLGHSGFGVCHLAQLKGTGCDSSAWRLPSSVKLRNMLTNTVYDATSHRVAFWIKGSVTGKAEKYFRVDCPGGISVRQENRVLDPEFDCPVIGMRVLIAAGFRMDANFEAKTVSVWLRDA